MKFCSCLLAFVCLAHNLFAQNVYAIKADSVLLTGCDSNELIIENHTQNVKGFLFNTGKGRTIFQKGAVKISESSYLIGADTLTVGGGFADSSTFYVQKRYTGTARAVIGGYTLASVSSTNSSYNSQLSKAAPGSILSCYPDPYSARNAALDAMAAGKIKHAQIVVLEGNQYTIGSNDSSKNGSIDGLHPNNGTIADIQFSNTAITADNEISSIMKNGIDTYFSLGTNFTYINSFYSIICAVHVDSTSTTPFKSGIYGEGTFYQVYGAANGFAAGFWSILDRNAVIEFHAQEVILQQFGGFGMGSFSICNIDITDLRMADANGFGIGSYHRPTPQGNAANAPQMAHIKVKNWKYGNNQIPYPTANDASYGILLGENSWLEGTVVTFDIGNLYMVSCDYSPLFYVSTGAAQYNVRMTVNIDNLVQKDSHLKYFTAGAGGLLAIYNTGIAVNNSITYNIKSARIEAPLLGWMNFSIYTGSKNNRFNINVGDLQKDSSAFAGGLFNLTSQYYAVGEPMVIGVRGNFRSYDNKPMLYVTNAAISYPFANKWVFSGRYNMAHSGLPVAHFYTNSGKILAFTDATLINDGTTPSLMADSTCSNFSCNCCQNNTPLSIPVYIKNVHANSGLTANVQQIGDTVKVVTDLPDFFNW